MIAMRVTAAGDILRCVTCGKPGVVAATDIPESLRRQGKQVVVYCLPCGLTVCATARRMAGMLRNPRRTEAARDFAREIEDLLKEVPPCPPES